MIVQIIQINLVLKNGSVPASLPFTVQIIQINLVLKNSLVGSGVGGSFK